MSAFPNPTHLCICTLCGRSALAPGLFHLRVRRKLTRKGNLDVEVWQPVEPAQEHPCSSRTRLTGMTS